MKIKALVAILAGMAIVGGCSPESRQKYDQAGDEVGSAAQKTTEAIATDASKTGQVIQQEASKAGEATKTLAEHARERTANVTVRPNETVGNAGETFQIKSAIMAAHDIKTTDLNVDTIGNQVILKGSVPTAQQKARAGAIAAKYADGKQVVNQLQVSGG